MGIYEKLAAIQNELKAPKNQRNTFGGYNYRSAEDILEAVKPLCKKHAVALIVADKMENIGERYYVCATARLYDAADGTFAESVAYAREEETKKGMDAAQITGSASSYARKYALNGLLAIDDTKDADSMDNRVEAQKTPAAPKPTPKAEKIERDPADVKARCEVCGCIISACEYDGKQIGVRAQIEGSKKATGKQMCFPCYKKFREAEKESSNA